MPSFLVGLTTATACMLYGVGIFSFFGWIRCCALLHDWFSGSGGTTRSISVDIRDQLHWLPVRQRIDYKLCVMVHNCLRSQAPSYLSEMLSTVGSVPGLHGNRSAARGDLNIPRTKTVTFGPRSFEVAGPTLWNSLYL